MTDDDIKVLREVLIELVEMDRIQQVQLDRVLEFLRMINKQCEGLNKRLEAVEYDLTQLSHATT